MGRQLQPVSSQAVLTPEVLRTSAWTSPPREYGESTVAGFPALVVGVTKTEVSLLLADMNGLYVRHVPRETLFEHVMPMELTSDPVVGARLLRSMTRTYFRARSPDVEAMLVLSLSYLEEVAEMAKEKKAVAPAAPAKQVKDKVVPFAPHVCLDHQRRTCIAVSSRQDQVSFIPLDEQGFDLLELSREDFERRYQPLDDYPVARAAALYVGYAVNIGGTPEAMAALAKFVTITQKELDMAAAKKAAKAAKAEKTAVKDKAKKPAAKAEKVAKAEKPVKEKVAKAPKGDGEARRTPAMAFRELIMKGKQTDDEIFAAVKNEFGLDDSKRSYVAWYRNDLRKKGENPPDAKEAK